MIRIETPLSRIIARTLAVTIANLALPFGFAGLIHDPLHPELPAAPKPVAAPSRLLSAKEQKQMSGKWITWWTG